jgi:hypothetical protein
MPAPRFAPLTASLVRRAGMPRPAVAPRAIDAADELYEEGGWRDDARLFAMTFAAGFLFFLVFLA